MSYEYDVEPNNDIDCYSNNNRNHFMVCFISASNSRFRVVNVDNLQALHRLDRTTIDQLIDLPMASQIGAIKIITSLVLL